MLSLFWEHKFRQAHPPSNRMRNMPPAKPLDRIDFALLAALQKDGRRSNKELAAEVGLAPSSALSRVRALRERDILRGVHARVDPRALGVGIRAMVSVVMRDQSAESRRQFWEDTQARREVVAMYNLSGAVDYLVEVMVMDTEHLRDFVLTTFAERPEVRQYTTSLIFDQARAEVLPCYREP